MNRESGNTQGFGRVSPVTRPSPYSPVQFRGRLPAAAGGEALSATPAAAPAPRVRGRRALAVLAVLAALAAVIGYLALPRTVEPPRTIAAPPSAPSTEAGGSRLTGPVAPVPAPVRAPRS